METRADFYVGRGPEAQWLGSVARDGDEWNNAESGLMKATTADEFRAAVAAIQAERDDFTAPSEGWPWPWNDSRLTDYAYVLHDGKVTAYYFGREVGVGNEEEGQKVDWFPDMRSRKNVQWGHKSGLLVMPAPSSRTDE